MSVSSDTQPHDEQSVLELQLPQNREAPSLARAAIATFSEDRDIDAATLATLTLLVSEIVTNAVIHPIVESPAGIALSARIAGGVIRVEVTDEGSGFTPQTRNPATTDRGYGLYLLDKQAASWGVDQQAGNTVWFELSVLA
jgi:anti-sigma regulatory factor (Ser/Thr protein kinase)